MATEVKIILGIFLILILLIFREIRKENREFVVTHYEIKTKKLKHTSLRIAFLSDLHGKEYGNENEELLEAIEKAHPDLILIGGDMIVGKKVFSSEDAAKLIEKLPKIAPVYYANGNHEQRIRERIEICGPLYEEYKERLERAGVTWLVNDSRTLEWDGNKIQITGTEAPYDCFKRLIHKEFEESELRELVGTSAKEGFQILLAHHPKFAQMYKNWGADLTLSGHLHGGVARLPIFGGIGVISPQIRLFPKYSGDCYDLGDDSHILVSKGLGTHTINIRFWNPAELIVLDIVGES